MKKHLLRLTSLLLAVVLLSGGSLTAFASSTATANTDDLGEESSSHGKYVKNFDESRYEGMTISYTEDGDPIIDDPDATHENALLMSKAITATTNRNTWMYQTSRLSTPLFMIPKGKVVTVLQTNSTWGSTQISYAGTKGWVYTSHLTLGS